ncbi:hypothetical protein ACWENQ_40290 [Nonomuraea sp. NPDC004354]
MSEHDASLELVQVIAEVVVLHATSGGLLPTEGHTPIELTTSEPPLSLDVVGQLLDSRARLNAPEVPYGLIDVIERQPVPAAFADHSWLSRYRPLVFTRDRCVIGGYRLRYSRRFGILLDEQEDPAARHGQQTGRA